MFITDLLVSHKSDHVHTEVEMICPTRVDTDRAEELLFYGDAAVAGVLFVRFAPQRIRLSILDLDTTNLWLWRRAFQHSDRALPVIHDNNFLTAHLPKGMSCEFLHTQRNAVTTRIHSDDVPYPAELRRALQLAL